MEIKCYGVGNVTVDPEVHQVGANNTSLCSVNLAFNRRFKSGDDWKDEVCFIQAKLWGTQADKFAEKCKKGTPVLIEGYLVQESWTDKKDVKHTTLVIRVNNFTVCERNNVTTKTTTTTKPNVPQNSKAKPVTQGNKPKAKPVQPEEEEPETVSVPAEDNDDIPF
jgi:single-strand DNA-binding protein